MSLDDNYNITSISGGEYEISLTFGFGTNAAITSPKTCAHKHIQFICKIFQLYSTRQNNTLYAI